MTEFMFPSLPLQLYHYGGRPNRFELTPYFYITSKITNNKNNNYKLYHFFEYQYIIEKFNKLFWQQENINFLIMF